MSDRILTTSGFRWSEQSKLKMLLQNLELCIRNILKLKRTNHLFLIRRIIRLCHKLVHVDGDAHLEKIIENYCIC